MFGDVRNPNSLQVFGYGNGNPLSFTDPSGERGEWAIETASMSRFEAHMKEMEDYYNSGGALWKAWNSSGFVHDSVRTRIKHAAEPPAPQLQPPVLTNGKELLRATQAPAPAGEGGGQAAEHTEV